MSRQAPFPYFGGKRRAAAERAGIVDESPIFNVFRPQKEAS